MSYSSGRLFVLINEKFNNKKVNNNKVEVKYNPRRDFKEIILECDSRQDIKELVQQYLIDIELSLLVVESKKIIIFGILY